MVRVGPAFTLRSVQARLIGSPATASITKQGRRGCGRKVTVTLGPVPGTDGEALAQARMARQ